MALGLVVVKVHVISLSEDIDSPHTYNLHTLHIIYMSETHTFPLVTKAHTWLTHSTVDDLAWDIYPNLGIFRTRLRAAAFAVVNFEQLHDVTRGLSNTSVDVHRSARTVCFNCFNCLNIVLSAIINQYTTTNCNSSWYYLLSQIS